MKILPIEEIQNMVGQETGVSGWFEINQERINQFADATNVFGLVHNSSPFPKPIARHAIWSAEVALLAAQPYFAPAYSATHFSKAGTCGP